ncbi:hypothetical protein [Streptomyces mirabilis]|uniref:hypothetical protein n=1 Tax=Streptomyces mirabilis TaxID=68239 RepID=UPI0036CF1BB2
MARPEAPIDYTVPELGRLAEHLRAMRHKARLTYADMALYTNYSAASLKRAASGESLPAAAVASQYALACLVNSKDRDSFSARRVKLLHEQAAEAVEQATRRARGSTVLPKPQYARDPGDLSGAMRDAWSRAGKPSARAMEKAVGGHLLPRTTANVIANGHSVPRDFRQYVAFLGACDISGSDLAPWFRAWFKIRRRPTWEEAYTASTWLDGTARMAYWDLLVKEADDSEAALAEVCAIIERVTGKPPGTIPLYAVDDSRLVGMDEPADLEVHGKGLREGRPIRCAA